MDEARPGGRAANRGESAGFGGARRDSDPLQSPQLLLHDTTRLPGVWSRAFGKRRRLSDDELAANRRRQAVGKKKTGWEDLRGSRQRGVGG